jgi:hypothetical protein
MRSAVSILSRLFLTAILLFGSVAAVLGEDGSEADRRPNLSREWHSIANGRTEFDISDPALVPASIARAAEQSGCRYKETIEAVPVRFIAVEKRRLALVFCPGNVVGSHHVFDLSDWKLKLMELPYLSQPDGFGTTDAPGLITWKKEAGVFQAETSSDLMCSSPPVRHTYRLGQTRSRASFVIVRVEVQQRMRPRPMDHNMGGAAVVSAGETERPVNQTGRCVFWREARR